MQSTVCSGNKCDRNRAIASLILPLDTLALQERAITFSTNVNVSYPAQMNYPSQKVWEQLVRAADGTDADFLNKLRTALREAKESKTCLTKIRLASLANAQRVLELGLEQEADELAAIYSTIITNMEIRLARERDEKQRKKRRNED